MDWPRTITATRESYTLVSSMLQRCVSPAIRPITLDSNMCPNSQSDRLLSASQFRSPITPFFYLARLGNSSSYVALGNGAEI